VQLEYLNLLQSSHPVFLGIKNPLAVWWWKWWRFKRVERERRV